MCVREKEEKEQVEVRCRRFFRRGTHRTNANNRRKEQTNAPRSHHAFFPRALAGVFSFAVHPSDGFATPSIESPCGRRSAGRLPETAGAPRTTRRMPGRPARRSCCTKTASGWPPRRRRLLRRRRRLRSATGAWEPAWPWRGGSTEIERGREKKKKAETIAAGGDDFLRPASRANSKNREK